MNGKLYNNNFIQYVQYGVCVGLMDMQQFSVNFAVYIYSIMHKGIGLYLNFSNDFDALLN